MLGPQGTTFRNCCSKLFTGFTQVFCLRWCRSFVEVTLCFDHSGVVQLYCHHHLPSRPWSSHARLLQRDVGPRGQLQWPDLHCWWPERSSWSDWLRKSTGLYKLISMGPLSGRGKQHSRQNVGKVQVVVGAGYEYIYTKKQQTCRLSSSLDWTTVMQLWPAYCRIFCHGSSQWWMKLLASSFLRSSTTSLHSLASSTGWRLLSVLLSSVPSSYTNVFTGLHRRTSSMDCVQWQTSRLVSDSILPRLHHWSLAALDYPLSGTEPFQFPLLVSATVYSSTSLLYLHCLSSGHASRLISSPFPIPVRDHVQCSRSDTSISDTLIVHVTYLLNLVTQPRASECWRFLLDWCIYAGGEWMLQILLNILEE